MAIPTRLFAIFFHPGCPSALCAIAIFGPSLEKYWRDSRYILQIQKSDLGTASEEFIKICQKKTPDKILKIFRGRYCYKKVSENDSVKHIFFNYLFLTVRNQNSKYFFSSYK